MDSTDFVSIAETLVDNIYSHPAAATVEEALLALSREPSVKALAPEAPLLAEALMESPVNSHIEREAALAELYRAIHTAGAEYSASEIKTIEQTHGIPRQPGGVTPLLMASGLIEPEATVVDLGAGNGLQGLLLRKLSPHKRTVLIEISGAMIEAGKKLQNAMFPNDSNIDWVHADLMDINLNELVPEYPWLLYLYRPVKPTGMGRQLYERIAKWISDRRGQGHIMSVADCLKSFLPESVKQLYEGEYFSLYKSPGA